MWFRASELKHGRVAMLATVGYMTGAAGITFPGEIAGGVSFASVNANGVFSAWSNVPEAGKLQVSSSPKASAARTRAAGRAAPRVWCGLNFGGTPAAAGDSNTIVAALRRRPRLAPGRQTRGR